MDKLEKAIEQSNDFLLAKPYSQHIHNGKEAELKIFTPDDEEALRLVIEVAESYIKLRDRLDCLPMDIDELMTEEGGKE